MLNATTFAAAALGLLLGLAGCWAAMTRTGWPPRLRERLGLARPTPQHYVRRADEMEWARNRNQTHAVHYLMKPLLNDERSGVVAMMVRYPAGQINPRHRHPAGHGAWVAEGTMVTHRGTFGAGSFVWFPAGEVMWHGATPDADLLVIYVTTGDATTEYLD